jgi:hypothetical protein
MSTRTFYLLAAVAVAVALAVIGWGAHELAASLAYGWVDGSRRGS